VLLSRPVPDEKIGFSSFLIFANRHLSRLE
jgi:hypothetical protein